MSADPIAAVVAFLKADAGVAALAGTRVFGLELPAAEAANMPRKAVVLRASGGPSLAAGTYLDHDSQRIDLVSYGETPFEAERLRRAIFDALKPVARLVVNSTLVHWIEPAGGFATQRDPDAAWPSAFQSFQVFFAESAAA
ncbi:MAG: DUF3168 domain-containing protein [Kiloniellaceae bacterium]